SMRSPASATNPSSRRACPAARSETSAKFWLARSSSARAGWRSRPTRSANASRRRAARRPSRATTTSDTAWRSEARAITPRSTRLSESIPPNYVCVPRAKGPRGPARVREMPPLPAGPSPLSCRAHRRQTQSLRDRPPVQVLEEPVEVLGLPGLVIREVGMLPAVDGHQHGLVRQQADVVLGLHEVVPDDAEVPIVGHQHPTVGRFRHGLEIGEGGVPRTVGALGLLLEGGRRLAALGPQVLEIQLVEHGAVVRHRLAPAQLRVLAEGVV